MKYEVIFNNNSTNYGDVCIYQTNPDIKIPNVMSLAWLTKAAHPTTKVTMGWTISYNFVWSNSGILKPGVQFEATQTWDADLRTKNQVNFGLVKQAYTFSDLGKGANRGSLYIEQEDTIPSTSVASVGIGMSGYGTFVVPAQPNVNLNFTPHPKYWITFGTFKRGEVLDITSISHQSEIVFPDGVYKMVATLQQDNTWVIRPLSS